MSDFVNDIRDQLKKLKVKNPKVFLPNDDDELTAAAAELVMLNEQPGLPTLDSVDLWLLNRIPHHTIQDAEKCLETYKSFYFNNDFRTQVLAPLGQESQVILREQDRRLKNLKET